LWRADRQQDQAGHQSRPHAAAARARLLAQANPERTSWRVAESACGHPPTRPPAAAPRARLLAQANPERPSWRVGDPAYVNAATLQDRPQDLQVIGPLHWKAALYQRPAPPVEGQK